MSLSLSHWYPGSGVVLIVSIPDLCTLTYLYEAQGGLLFLSMSISVGTLVFMSFFSLKAFNASMCLNIYEYSRILHCVEML